jgi:hypothetical protein
MKVNHLHLMVPDVRASADVFQKSAPGAFLVEVGA